jgi:hypothetical protein
MTLRRALSLFGLIALTASPAGAEVLRAPGPSDFRLRSIATTVSGFSQRGYGYQSRATSRVLDPGSERLTVLQPSLVAVIEQGEKMTHTILVPVDFVTSASANAIDTEPNSTDVVSQASRQTESASLDWTASYAARPDTHFNWRNVLHIEESFRSFQIAVSGDQGFADGATTMSASASHTFDWFENYDISGHRHGRTNRSTGNLSVGLTQILSPTTLAHLDYGFTRQDGQLGNTWNTVPLLDTWSHGPEILPRYRMRHALVGRVAQFLPWNGVIKTAYRLYGDDWGIVAHSLETQLLQRFFSFFYAGLTYRVHRQQGARFFTTLGLDDGRERTADSDLATFTAQTFGGRAVFDIPISESSTLHLTAAYERYQRTNGLRMDIGSISSGVRF